MLAPAVVSDPDYKSLARIGFGAAAPLPATLAGLECSAISSNSSRSILAIETPVAITSKRSALDRIAMDIYDNVLYHV
jgi:hypothetical protein